MTLADLHIVVYCENVCLLSEFPVSEEGKSLLSYIVEATNTTFVQVLEKWNQMNKYETLLKPLVPDSSRFAFLVLNCRLLKL